LVERLIKGAGAGGSTSDFGDNNGYTPIGLVMAARKCSLDAAFAGI
jgi:hypothetical protein